MNRGVLITSLIDARKRVQRNNGLIAVQNVQVMPKEQKEAVAMQTGKLMQKKQRPRKGVNLYVTEKRSWSLQCKLISEYKEINDAVNVQACKLMQRNYCTISVQKTKCNN